MIPLRYRQAAKAPVSVPSQHQAAVERFARSLGVKHFSPHTRRLYVAAVSRWLAAGGAPGHVDEARLLDYLRGRRATCAVATVNLDLKALRAFYRLQLDWDDLGAAELAKIPRGRATPRRLPRFFDEADLGRRLAAIPLDTFVGLRDFCLIRLALDTGLRASELAALEAGSLLADRTVFVDGGKGGRDRYVPVSEAVAGLMEGYLHARARLRPGKRAALWLARDGRPMVTGRAIWEVVSRRLGPGGGARGLRAAGRAWQGAYPHMLRATFATALLRSGCPLPAIAQMMGHADMATTAHYLGVELEQLRAAVALHPRALRVGSSPGTSMRQP